MPTTSVGLGEVSSVTRRGKTEPFDLQISRGQVYLHNPFKLHGYSAAINNVNWQPMWEGASVSGGLYPYPGSAATLVLASSSASDTMKLQVNGLDSNFDMLQEIVTMNGVSNVTTTNSFLRITSLVCMSGNNVGTITAKISAVTYAQINPTIGVTQMSVFTVPRNYTLYVTYINTTRSLDATGTTDDNTIFQVYTSRNIQNVVTMNGFSVSIAPAASSITERTVVNVNGSLQYNPPDVYTEGMDIQFCAKNDTLTASTATTAVCGYLIRNTSG